MTPEEIIDREKVEREREVEALLLALFLLARRYATSALRLGLSPYDSLAAVLMGSQVLGLPGGAARLAAILAIADYRGYRRTELLVPGDRFIYRPGTDYRSTAGQALALILASLQRRVGSALSTARSGVSGAVAAIVGAFRVGGYTDANPYRAAGAAATLVGQAYGTGYYEGFQRPGLPQIGFRYSAVLDSSTTEICHAYNAVRLPRDHRWWLSHWPLNHWGCRSVVLPIVGEFERTPEADIPWLPMPMAGFGRSPFSAYAALTRPAA